MDDENKKLEELLSFLKDKNLEEPADNEGMTQGNNDTKRAEALQKDILKVILAHNIEPNLVDLTIVGKLSGVNALAGFTSIDSLTIEQAAIYFNRVVPTVINLLPDNVSKKEKANMFHRMMMSTNQK